MDALTVMARGNILVLDVEHAKSGGRRAYIGRTIVRAWDEKDLPPDCPRHLSYNEFLEPGNDRMPHSAFPSSGNAVEVPNDSYHRKAVAKGALWPADTATAVVCGVMFDPDFGGEYPNKSKGRGKDRGKDGDK